MKKLIKAVGILIGVLSMSSCDKLAPLYWDDNNQAAKDNCLRLLKPLSSKFKVSVEAMKWRLKSLNLLTIGKSMLHSEPRLLRYF